MTDPQAVARKLLSEAWQHATREAIDAHLRRDGAASAHWSAVMGHLKAIAPKPGAGDLDVYRSAKLLMSEKGAQDAWHHAMQRSAEAQEDLPNHTYWLRVADAVTSLADGRSRNGA